jgi:hypothetical protein
VRLRAAPETIAEDRVIVDDQDPYRLARHEWNILPARRRNQ